MNNTVLKKYFEKSNLSMEYMKEKAHKNFDLFLSGDKIPTFNQLVKIAKIFNIPTGLLLLKEPISEEVIDINFRTFNSSSLNNLSENLKDTIKEMKFKQSFLQDEIDSEVDFVNSATINDNVSDLAKKIRATLKININYYESVPRKKIQAFIRSKMNNAGVFVFFNGKVGDNTHRPLELSEFRGFVLVDRKAPIIFVNQRDTKNGQLFTMVHEFVHLFIGDEEIFGLENDSFDFDSTESFVNGVTAEILVPESEFIVQFQKTQAIETLADHFRVSKFVILKRMFDFKLISKNEYFNKLKELKDEYNEIKDHVSNKDEPGGSYKHNLRYRVDTKFFDFIESALNSYKISYTDAFKLLGVGYKGYKTLKDTMH